VSTTYPWRADSSTAPLRDSETRQVAAGQRPTVRDIVEEHSAQVWRTLRYLGVASADLHDACQDVFLVIYRKLGEFEHRSSLRTWVYGICVRVASSYRRSARRRHEEVVAEPPELPVLPTQLSEVEDHRTRQRLLAILDKLDSDKREVFVLFEIEDRSMAEIAATVACPLRTVYSRLEAARKEIAREWRQHELRERLR
jgi:RNA polymerase sigma-70 factor (ECF subfamily)